MNVKANLKEKKMKIHFFVDGKYQATIAVAKETERLWPCAVVLYGDGEHVQIQLRRTPLSRGGGRRNICEDC